MKQPIKIKVRARQTDVLQCAECVKICVVNAKKKKNDEEKNGLTKVKLKFA